MVVNYNKITCLVQCGDSFLMKSPFFSSSAFFCLGLSFQYFELFVTSGKTIFNMKKTTKNLLVSQKTIKSERNNQIGSIIIENTDTKC